MRLHQLAVLQFTDEMGSLLFLWTWELSAGRVPRPEPPETEGALKYEHLQLTPATQSNQTRATCASMWRPLNPSSTEIQNSRHPHHVGCKSDFTAVWNRLYLKPAFAISLHFTWNQMNRTERVNSDPTFCAATTTKIHRSVGISALRKSKWGKWLKRKNKTYVQYFLTKSWNTGFLADAVLCVWRACVWCVFYCALAKLAPWLLKVWVLLLCIQAFVFLTSWYILVICHLPHLSTFCFSISLDPLCPSKCVSGQHTRLQPVKLSITMTASPASLTGLLNSAYADWWCSGFLCLWSSLVRVWHGWKGRV